MHHRECSVCARRASYRSIPALLACQNVPWPPLDPILGIKHGPERPRPKPKIGCHGAGSPTCTAPSSLQGSETRFLSPETSIPSVLHAFRHAGCMPSPKMEDLIFGRPSLAQKSVLYLELLQTAGMAQFSMGKLKFRPIPTFCTQRIRSSCSHNRKNKL